MNRLQFAIDQISGVRAYTLGLLNGTKADDWFKIPTAGVSHIGWQVGHLTIAQYRLALLKIRGEMPEDSDLIPADYVALFGRGSPAANTAIYPTVDKLREVFDAVHAQALKELPGLSESELDVVLPQPHPIAKTPFTSLIWCGLHEMTHAGQIGLLRRQLGYDPLW